MQAATSNGCDLRKCCASYSFVIGIVDGNREASEFDAKAAMEGSKQRFDVLI